MNTQWKIALRNLGRNKRRNIATGLAIAFGYAGLILLGGYIIRTENYLRVNSVYLNHAGHISVWKKDAIEKYLVKPAAYSLTHDEQNAIEKAVVGDSRVEYVGRYLKTAGLASNGCRSVPFFAWGIETHLEKKLRSHPLVAKWSPELAQFKKGKGFWEYPDVAEAVGLASGLSDLLGKTNVWEDVKGNPVSTTVDCTSHASFNQDANIQLMGRTFAGDFSAVNADIVSQFATGMALTEESSMVAPLGLLQTLYDTDQVTYMALYLKSGVLISSYISELEEKLKDLNVSIYPFDTEDISLFYVGSMNFLYTMAGFFVFLVFGVVVLSIINSVTMSVIERTREVGTLRSIGFQPRYIAWLFVREGAVLTLISLIFGSISAFLVATVVNRMNFKFRPPGVSGDMAFVLSPTIWLCSALSAVVLLITVITIYRVTLRRSRQSVVQLLTDSVG